MAPSATTGTVQGGAFSGEVVQVFSNDLARTFTRPLARQVKLTTICRLMADVLQASSVSLLAYHGETDQLECIGRYLQQPTGDQSATIHPVFRDILRHGSAYEFIFFAEDGERSRPAHLYQTFMRYTVPSPAIAPDRFAEICAAWPRWRDDYHRYRAALAREVYPVDANTITGSYFLRLLAHEDHFHFDSLIRDLSRIPIPRRYCVTIVEEELGIVLDSRYYLALPLFANNRYFGVLRILLDADTPYLGGDGSLALDETVKGVLEKLTRLISLQLESDYFLEGYKRLNELTASTTIDYTRDLPGYLANQCALMSRIIECRGAMVVLWDRDRQALTIAARSDSVADLATERDRGDCGLFEAIRRALQERPELSAAHFNALERPRRVTCYSRDAEWERSVLREETWPLAGVDEPLLDERMTARGLGNLAVLPIPSLDNSYVLFANSPWRPFLMKDVAMVASAVRRLGMKINIARNQKQIERRQSIISEMHEALHRLVVDEELGAHEYVKSFYRVLGKTIRSFGYFSHVFFWQYVSEAVPRGHGDDCHRFHNKTSEPTVENPFAPDNQHLVERNAVVELRIGKEGFRQLSRNGAVIGALEPILPLSFREEFVHFDVPFRTVDDIHADARLIGMFSFVMPREGAEAMERDDFRTFMLFLMKQFGIAWNMLLEKIATKIQERIDAAISDTIGDENGLNSQKQELTRIADILAREFDCELCCFVLKSPSEESLVLEASNVSLVEPHLYPLDDPHHSLTVQSYFEKRNYRLSGRKRIEALADVERLEAIERQLKGSVLTGLLKDRKQHFHEICVEHWLSVVITFAGRRLGLIKLFRIKGMNNFSDLRERHRLVTTPFSELETEVLSRIQKHIYNIIKTHQLSDQLIQARFEDRLESMRNVVHQLVAPLGALIQHCDNLIEERVPQAKVKEKLLYVSKMSKQSARQARSFQKILDLETGNVHLVVRPVRDLKAYLIKTAIDFQPFARRKGITIHVGDERSDQAPVALDRALFLHVVANLLDNAVKYSFDSDQRRDRGLSGRPQSTESLENILLTIVGGQGDVEIHVSNFGLAIRENERELVFNREFRGREAQDFSPNGSGIGLYLAREIVRMHGGDLTLLSQDDPHLTAFVIQLPIGADS